MTKPLPVVHWDISIYPAKDQGDGLVHIVAIWEGRILQANIHEDYRKVVITASNQANLDQALALYDLMQRNLPYHRPLRFAGGDETKAMVATAD